MQVKLVWSCRLRINITYISVHLRQSAHPTSSHVSVAEEMVFKRQRQRNCTAFSRCAMTLLRRRSFLRVLHMSGTCLADVKTIHKCTMCFRWMSAWLVHVLVKADMPGRGCGLCLQVHHMQVNQKEPKRTKKNRHELALLIVFLIWRRQVIWRYEARACQALSGNMFDPSSAVWAGLWLNILELVAERLTKQVQLLPKIPSLTSSFQSHKAPKSLPFRDALWRLWEGEGSFTSCPSHLCQ